MSERHDIGRCDQVKLGVFGGSFDPVHIGHLIVAEAAADALRLDSVLFIPAHTQPFKQGAHGAAPEDRVAMLRLALAGNPRFRLDTREIERGGVSYAVDTLRELAREFPKDELFLMVGADAARDLTKWREASEIANLASIVILSRPGASRISTGIPTTRLTVPAIDLSATQVRKAVRQGRSVRYWVPQAVQEYIESHGLYADQE